MKTRLEEHYHKNIHPSMVEKFNYKNKFEVPKLQKLLLILVLVRQLKIQRKLILRSKK